MQAHTRPLPLAVALATLFALTLVTAAPAQMQSQTLPAGFETTLGNSSTALPFSTTSDQVWQWHYDSTEFAATGEIRITEIYVRVDQPTSELSGFSFSGCEVTLAEASTDYRAASHVTALAGNVQRSTIVREGAFVGDPVPASGGLTGEWVSLQLRRGFTYDPSTGRDFIVQIRKCTTNAAFDTSIDVVSGGAGTVGGNRYGHTSSCTATTESFRNNEAVPIIKIDYHSIQSQTLPAGFDTTNGGSGTGFPQNTTSNQKWQWHYDASEFAASGPIAISEISVRCVTPTTALTAFDFPFFNVTLIEAATDYRVGNHNPVFANNVFRSRAVKNSSWRSEGVAASNGAAATWISFGLDDTFVYDPSTGRDFIIEIQKCSTTTAWGASMDGISNVAGQNGGNRYGHTSDCFASLEDFSNNEYVPIVKIDYAPITVSTFPYHETFDSTAANGITAPPFKWSQDEADAGGDWFFRNIQTPSTNTGPLADHTTGIPGMGYYAHTEDSNGEQVAVNLKSPIFQLGPLTTPALSFWVQSRDANGGTNENFLDVDLILHPGGALVPGVISSVGDLGSDQWEQRFVNLATFGNSNVQIVFRGQTDGGSFSHDLAIDDVRIFDLVVGAGGSPNPGVAVLDINESLDVNGLGTGLAMPGPFFAESPLGGDLHFHLEGEPGMPIALLAGPLNPGLISFPLIGQFDIGTGLNGNIPTGIFLVADGTSGNPLDSFWRTDIFGEFDLTVTAPFLPLGTTFTFQGAVFNSGIGAGITNAVQIVVTP